METDMKVAATATGPTPASPNALMVAAPPPAAKDEMKWLSVPRDEMMATLKASLYPGASDGMVQAVMDYCAAAGLNIMLKPVHIVPMFIPKKEVDRDGRKVTVEGTGVMRDIIMPGINHYRVQASRSGVYLGKTAPEWGPIVEYSLSQGTNQQGQPNGPDIKVSVPEWCRITVFKLVAGHIVPFTAEEYWIENYATQSRYTKAPNAMWAQRSRGQLAKVTEAQALRQAFPELCGGETAEEMEGKAIELERGADGVHRSVDKPVQAGKALDEFAGAAERAKPATKAKGKPKAEAEPINDGTFPDMPDDILKAYQEDRWGLAWKWINEEMPKLGPVSRQEMADRYANLLRVVYNHSDNQRKAAEEFVERMGVTVGAAE